MRPNPTPRPNPRLVNIESRDLGLGFYVVSFWLPLIAALAVIVYVGMQSGWR